MNPSRRGILVDSLLVVCLATILIGPLFRLKYLDNWSSIESTFISDARMLGEHLPHTGWQPLWYGGTRMDYVYPPALRYGTVLISRISHAAPARAYHLYIAAFYVLGLAAVYWLVRAGSGSRGAAWLASLATALLSPSFLLLPKVRADSNFLVPWRLHVLTTYGEGPHISAVCVLTAALAATWMALRSGRTGILLAAAALSALVVANNFYGAVSYAILYLILVWAVYLADGARSIWRRALVIPVLAGGLSAFWLTPSYLKLTLVDLKWVSPPADLRSRLILLAAACAWGVASFFLCRGRPERAWAAFSSGALVVFGVIVLGYYYFDLRITGDAMRVIPELDLALIFVAVEGVRALWRRPRMRVVASLAVGLAFSLSWPYLRHAWTPFPKSAPLEQVYEYKTTKWVADHLPGARLLPSGSLRYWFDAWADNAQIDGGSAQGMANQAIPDAVWQIQHGAQANLAKLWLQALGTDAVIVAGKKSPDAYHDFEHEEKFRGVLPVLYDDGNDTLIYGIPRIHPGLARVVNTASIGAAGTIAGALDTAGLARYVSVVEDPAQGSASLQWNGFDQASVAAKVGAGQSVLVQETWDAAWHAYEGGRELPIRREPGMGFMLIDVPAGNRQIQLHFEMPLENRIGWVILATTIAVMAGLAITSRYSRRIV